MSNSRNKVVLAGVLAACAAVTLLAQTVRSPASQFPSVHVETAGTNGAPSIAFVGNATCGFFNISTGQVAVSCHLVPGVDNTDDLGSASNAFRNLYAKGAIVGITTQAASGSAGAPSYSFASAATKGLYLFDANTMGVSGFLKAGVDATYDIGGQAANRFQNGYFSNIVTGAKVQVGAGAPTTSNVTLRSSDAAGRLSVMLGDESAKADVYGLRLNGISVQSAPGAAVQPACDSAHEGTIWVIPSAAGVATKLQACGADAGGTYAWVTLL